MIARGVKLDCAMHGVVFMENISAFAKRVCRQCQTQRATYLEVLLRPQ